MARLKKSDSLKSAKDRAIEIRTGIQNFVKDYCKKEGITLLKSACTYDLGGNYTIKFNLFEATKEGKALAARVVETDQTIQSGFALPDTLAWVKWPEDGQYYLCRILKVNRLKYVFEWLDDPGKLYNGPFRAFYAINPVTKQPAIVNQ